MAATGPDGASAEEEARKPITDVAGCCVRAANGQTAAPPPNRPMNSRRFIFLPADCLAESDVTYRIDSRSYFRSHNVIYVV
jgi:hypothetical protein